MVTVASEWRQGWSGQRWEGNPLKERSGEVSWAGAIPEGAREQEAGGGCSQGDLHGGTYLVGQPTPMPCAGGFLCLG